MPCDEADGQNAVILLVIIFVGVLVRINTVCTDAEYVRFLSQTDFFFPWICYDFL